MAEAKKKCKYGEKSGKCLNRQGEPYRTRVATKLGRKVRAGFKKTGAEGRAADKKTLGSIKAVKRGTRSMRKETRSQKHAKSRAAYK